MAKKEKRPTFKEIWKVFSTGHGRIYKLDAISLSMVFIIAEQEFCKDRRASPLKKDFLDNEDISDSQLEHLISEVKKNTKIDGIFVFNSDGKRRYENLADVGLILTGKGPRTVVLTESGLEYAD